ncbi:MAG: zinc ribbon domain-containing protein [Syntrophotaleaceae bacterium]
MYEYQCEECGLVFEARQKFSDEPLTECKQCGGPVNKLITPRRLSPMRAAAGTSRAIQAPAAKPASFLRRRRLAVVVQRQPTSDTPKRPGRKKPGSFGFNVYRTSETPCFRRTP